MAHTIGKGPAFLSERRADRRIFGESARVRHAIEGAYRTIGCLRQDVLGDFQDYFANVSTRFHVSMGFCDLCQGKYLINSGGNLAGFE